MEDEIKNLEGMEGVRDKIETALEKAASLAIRTCVAAFTDHGELPDTPKQHKALIDDIFNDFATLLHTEIEKARKVYGTQIIRKLVKHSREGTSLLHIHFVAEDWGIFKRNLEAGAALDSKEE